MLQVARYLGVAPWQVEQAPVVWQDRVAQVIDAEAERDQRAAKKTKGR